jgi:hypothetical protein
MVTWCSKRTAPKGCTRSIWRGVPEFGNQDWQSNERHGEDDPSPGGFRRELRATGADGQDCLDESDGSPEPVAQVRVLPGAHCLGRSFDCQF